MAHVDRLARFVALVLAVLVIMILMPVVIGRIFTSGEDQAATENGEAQRGGHAPLAIENRQAAGGEDQQRQHVAAPKRLERRPTHRERERGAEDAKEKAENRAAFPDQAAPFAFRPDELAVAVKHGGRAVGAETESIAKKRHIAQVAERPQECPEESINEPGRIALGRAGI